MLRIDRENHTNDSRHTAVQEMLVCMEECHALAMIYRPVDPAVYSGTAVLLMHSDDNYMSLEMGPALAEYGYMALAAEAWSSGELDRKCELLDSWVRWLRERNDVDRVILMGHSGGATLMTAYQAIAENGPEIFRREGMIYPCTIRDKLEPADGIMLIDANYGNGVMTLLSLDPAVETEGSVRTLTPEYDSFEPANGYSPNGAAYRKDFIEKYEAAQAMRNERLISVAQERLKLIERGEGDYEDDEPFILAAASQAKPNNRLINQDVHLLSHTKTAHTLLHGNGTVTYEVVHCLRTPEVDRSFSRSYEMGANRNSVKGFLNSQAIRASSDFQILEDDIIGVDWDSSYASPIGNIQHVHCPALFVGMTGSYEYLASEMIYDHAPMTDKTLAFVRGASHNFTPNHMAETQYGSFGDTAGTLYRYMAHWMEQFSNKGEV